MYIVRCTKESGWPKTKQAQQTVKPEQATTCTH